MRVSSPSSAVLCAVMAGLTLATTTTIPVPPETASVQLVSNMSSELRLLAATFRPSPLTALIDVTQTIRVVERPASAPTWIAPTCAVDPGACLVGDVQYTVRPLAANGTALGLPITVHPPPDCAVTVTNITGNCATVSVTGGGAPRVVVRGVAALNAMFPLSVLSIAGEFEVSLTGGAICGLTPLTVYSVWARHLDDGRECAARITTAQAPLSTPVIIEHVFVTTFSFSFLVYFDAYTTVLEALRVTTTNTRTNATVEEVQRYPTSALPTISSTGAFVIRTFTPLTLDANTNYTVSVRVVTVAGAALSAESSPYHSRTSEGVQPRPATPVLVSNSGDVYVVHVPQPAFEAALITHSTNIMLVEDVPDTLEDRVIFEAACSGTCLDGFRIPKTVFTGVRVAFASVVVINTVGVSARSARLSITFDQPSSSTNLSDSEIAAIVASVLVVVAVLVVAVWLWASRYTVAVPVFRPAPIPGIECERGEIVLMNKIGAGSTSVVHLATFRNREVAVKQMVSTLTYTQMQGFFDEIAQLHQLKHPNIVKLLGAVTTSDPVWIVTEYCANGALDELLRQHVLGVNDPLPLRKWAREMAASVMYLHQQKIIHRDIATRNFLVHADGTLKMCDLGMSKNLYYLETYRLNEPLPISIRWASPRVIFERVFSYASDTWSFSVALNELYNFGAIPFSDKSEAEVIEYILIDKGRPIMANAMPTDLKRIILSIWTETSVSDTATMTMFAEALELTPGLPELPAATEDDDDDDDDDDDNNDDDDDDDDYVVNVVTI